MVSSSSSSEDEGEMIPRAATEGTGTAITTTPNSAEPRRQSSTERWRAAASVHPSPGVDDQQQQVGSTTQLFDRFETCATSVARLYRAPHWTTFQTAAASATQLYKESVEAQRRAYERGHNVGRQRMIKELLAFYRRHGTTGNCPSGSGRVITVRRDGLLAFLADASASSGAGGGSGGGGSPVHHHHNQQRSRGSTDGNAMATGSSPLSRAYGQLNRLCLSPSVQQATAAAAAVGGEVGEAGEVLYLFHEALVPPSQQPETTANSSPSSVHLAAAGSSRSMAAGRRSPDSGAQQQQRGHNNHHQDLSAFLREEFRRNRKRRFSPDVGDRSPTSGGGGSGKRFRRL